MLLCPQPGVKRWPIIMAIVVAQVCQLRFGFGFPYGDYIGLPGWGYLLSMLLITYSTISYYHAIYSYPLKQHPPRFAATTTAGMAD